MSSAVFSIVILTLGQDPEILVIMIANYFVCWLLYRPFPNSLITKQIACVAAQATKQIVSI